MWKFRELQVGETERNPHEAEFFKLTDPSEAVVREFVQNSLDARVDKDIPVRVRIVLSSVLKNTMEKFLGPELREHLKASGLFPSYYETLSCVPFVTIEDFGTTGLGGETDESARPSQGKLGQNFYYFWKCEGISVKTGKDAGRWGLGKTTFHMASRLRTFWGFTVRSDDNQQLLLGKALLKAHRINNRAYDYDGYYAKDKSNPIEDKDLVEQFRKTFSLKRKDEAGLSIVIPAPDSEIDLPSIIRSVILHYFYAIMSGNLEVEINGAAGPMELKASNLTENATKADFSGTPWENINIKAFLKFIEKCIQNKEFYQLPQESATQLMIDENSFGESLDRMRENFAATELIAIRVPVRVQEFGKDFAHSYFHVFAMRDATLKAPQEYYVRSGITIVGIKQLGGRPVKALFVAEDPVITSFLGDSETPAHTEWNEKTEDFKGKYVDASKVLRFIKKSVASIVSLLDLPPKEKQVDFLRDIFSVVNDDMVETDEIVVHPPKPVIPKSQPKFEITKTSNGIRVQLTDKEIKLPLRSRLMVAYDVRGGNPFRQYEKYDFDLSAKSLGLTIGGCEVNGVEENVVDFEVTNHDFTLEVSGFDPRRDLVADVKEVVDETQA